MPSEIFVNGQGSLLQPFIYYGFLTLLSFLLFIFSKHSFKIPTAPLAINLACLSAQSSPPQLSPTKYS
uniref:Uncharacterized protein n=1 Tax=Pseudonaja textilis TaxID=8673 RepID=A0A670ZU67_PSETE